MPKQTFFNLSAQKRQTIEQAALDEFAEYGFDASNMNRIVEQSKIAKGSFYQYFEDKKDLYFYLIDTLFRKKLQAIEPVLKVYEEHSLSHNLKEIFRFGLEFSANDPKLHRLGEDFSTMQRPFVLEFLDKYKPETTDIYISLLTHAREIGELREDVDISLAAVFISAIIKQATFILMENNMRERETVVRELLSFIERAILKQQVI